MLAPGRLPGIRRQDPGVLIDGENPYAVMSAIRCVEEFPGWCDGDFATGIAAFERGRNRNGYVERFEPAAFRIPMIRSNGGISIDVVHKCLGWMEHQMTRPVGSIYRWGIVLDEPAV